jgi:membrane protein
MAKPGQTALAGWLDRARDFLEGLPAEGVSARPIMKKLQRAAHFLLLVWRGFSGNRCPVRAAALSYTTLLALIPLLAVGVSVSKNFLHDTSADLVPKLMDQIVTYIAPALEYMPVQGQSVAPAAGGRTVVSSEAKREAVEKIQSFIENINSGALTTVGSVFLAFVAIRLLMTIEQTFNDIWGVLKGRSIWRKVVYYWTTITLGSLLLFVAIYMTGKVEFLSVFNQLELMPGLEKVFFHLTPFFVLWIGFSLMYGLMPNTQVRAHAAVVGGIVGGTLWQLNNLLNTLYVSRVVTYGKIYGALGIIPVFLAGLYVSWFIVLLGAQVSYATQNFHAYLQHRSSARIDQRGRELIACRVVLIACHNFVHRLKPPSIEEIAERVGASPQWLNQLVHRLTQGGLLSEIADDQSGLMPARPPDSITIADVLHVVRTSHGACAEPAGRHGSDPVETLLGELYAAARSSPANMKFSELVVSPGPRPDKAAE